MHQDNAALGGGLGDSLVHPWEVLLGIACEALVQGDIRVGTCGGDGLAVVELLALVRIVLEVDGKDLNIGAEETGACIALARGRVDDEADVGDCREELLLAFDVVVVGIPHAGHNLHGLAPMVSAGALPPGHLTEALEG